jgi:hemerythrin-like domain-containing protein
LIHRNVRGATSAMIAKIRLQGGLIEILRQEHRNIEKLLFVLEREVGVFARGDRPDYEVVHALITYFQVYPDEYHDPLEDLVIRRAEVAGTRRGP